MYIIKVSQLKIKFFWLFSLILKAYMKIRIDIPNFHVYET